MTHDPLQHPDPDAAAEALAERAGQLLAVLDGEEQLEPQHLADVGEALPLLRRAVALAPHHPDLVIWCRAAGWAHAVRGDVSDDPADREAAVDWTRRAGMGDHPDLDPDDLALDLAHLLVLRNRARYAPEDANGIVKLLADLETDGPPTDDGTLGWAAFAVPRGLAHLDALDAGLGIDHLDQAHVLLAGAVDRLPDHAALLLDGLFALGRTSMFTDRPDPGLAAIRRARTLDPDLDPVELDLMAVELLERRWDLQADPTDLDAAVTLLHGAHTARPEDRTLTCWLAQRLAERGDHHDDVADLAAAIDLFADPDQEPVDDPAAQAMAWYVLGLAHLTRWRLVGADVDRDRAEAYLATLVDLDPPDVGLLLDTHFHRLQALDDRVQRTPDRTAWERSDAALRQVEMALDRAAEHIDQVSPDTALELREGRSKAALAAAVLETKIVGVNGMRVDRLRRLADIADEHPDPPAQWDATISAVRTTLGIYDDTIAEQGGRTRGHLTAVATGTDQPEQIESDLREMFGMSGFLEALWSGDMTRMAASEMLLDGADPGQAMIAAWARFMRTSTQWTRLDELVAGLDDLIEHCAREGSSHGRLMAEVVQRLRSLAVPDPGVLDRAWPAVERINEAEPGSVIHDVLTTGVRIIDLQCRLNLLPDHEARRTLLVEIGDATDRAERGPIRFIGLLVLMHWWPLRAREAPGDPEALDEAVRWTAAALADLPGHGHPLWGRTALSAADARRLRDRLGDRTESRRLGLESLRARTWSVLLQAGADEARAMARAAAGEALRVARWCAADRGHPGADEDLVAALEAGRGLVLHAALTTRGIAGRLVDAGHAELAREWQEAGGDDLLAAQVPALHGSGLRGDLRRRVLDAVDGERTDLLTPPDPDHLRAALRAQGTDALVYLMAGDAEHPGLAVLVPAGAPIEVLDLPRLRSAPDSPLTRYTTAHSAWRATGHDPEERATALQQWRAALSELTRWAWTAAAEDVLAATAVTATDPARPRLTLVPVGELALVPWHAAGPGEVPGDVLAARAIVSSTPSARMLCQVLARPLIPAGDTLIVGDPTGDLVAARAEAQALRSTFYRDATYVGRGGRDVVSAGRGASGDVLDRLGMPHEVVHLACHAHVEPDDPARSGLRMADGDLAVADLLGHRPTQRLPLDTVLLAACSTNVSGTEYDEAFSVATAFLAAGARTVFGSLWEVPDGATSELMFMVHHGLRVDGLAPAEALHRAQLWVLDPDRVRPPGMPAEPVAAGARSGEPAAPGGDPLAWAGFVHLGA